MRGSARNAIRGALVLIASACFIQAPNAEALSLREYRLRLEDKLAEAIRDSRTCRGSYVRARGMAGRAQGDSERLDEVRDFLYSSIVETRMDLRSALDIGETAERRLDRFETRVRAKVRQTQDPKLRKRFFTRLRRIDALRMKVDDPADAIGGCYRRLKSLERRYPCLVCLASPTGS
jgi:hypothetical protein